MTAHLGEEVGSVSVIRQAEEIGLVSLQTRASAAACRGTEGAQRLTDASNRARGWMHV